MPGRKRSQSKRYRKTDSHTITSTYGVAPRGRHAKNDVTVQGGRKGEVGFSDPRRSQRATRGYVDTLTPRATTGESDGDYSRRMGRRGYVQEVQRKRKRRRRVSVALAALLVIAVAAAVGLFTYFSTSDARLSLSDSNAAEALIAPAAEERAYYALLAADLGTGANPHGTGNEGYLLVRIDEGARQLSFVGIPANLQVTLSDGKDHALSEAVEVGGDAELVSAVAQFAAVDIAHFARTDGLGLESMVNTLGGVSVDVAEEVDDPRAGTAVIEPGTQILDGRQALTFLRASNFSDPLQQQMADRVTFTVNLASAAMSSQTLSFAAAVADLSESVQTDWTSSQLIALGDGFRPLSEATVYAALVPGRQDDGGRYIANDDAWSTLMENVRLGKAPDSEDEAVAAVDPATVTVEVRNGGGVTGAAATMAEKLKNAGYAVGDVGNAEEGAVYPETLVIYRDPAYEAAAQAVVGDMNAGRVVNGGDFYTFTGNVLVVVGKDWVPVL